MAEATSTLSHEQIQKATALVVAGESYRSVERITGISRFVLAKLIVLSREPDRNLDGEVWKTIPGYEGRYSASNLGRVRRHIDAEASSWRVLQPGYATGGYKVVTLYPEHGRRQTSSIHRIIARTFLGTPPPLGMEVNHIDGDKENNRPENLEYVTRAENLRHAGALGLKRYEKGENHGMAKLSDEDVVTILKLLRDGTRPKEVSRQFSISVPHVHRIRNGECWGHIRLPTESR